MSLYPLPQNETNRTWKNIGALDKSNRGLKPMPVNCKGHCNPTTCA